jgi:DNA-binding MarR family transcriptional regulator
VDHDERDLGELFARITERLIAAERPILARHGLEMWPYVVLARLARGSAATQLELAMQVGYDKTRLIAILDDLVREGLVERRPDPADRRARNVSLTPAGAERVAAARSEIRAMETEILSDLTDAQRRELRGVLAELASR